MRFIHLVLVFIISLFFVTSVHSQEVVDVYSNLQFCDVTVEGDADGCLLKSDLRFMNDVIQTKSLPLDGPGTSIIRWDYFEAEDGPYSVCATLQKGEDFLSQRCYSFDYAGRVPLRFEVRDLSVNSEGIDLLILANDPSVVDVYYMLIKGNRAIYVNSWESYPIMAQPLQVSWDWKQILENNVEYAGMVKITEKKTNDTRSFMKLFIAEDKAEITDTYEDETGASATVLGRSRVPFEGKVRFILSQNGTHLATVEKKTPILLSGDDETVEISWNDTLNPGVYQLEIQLIGNDDDLIDLVESIIEAVIVPKPVAVIEETEESSGVGTAFLIISTLTAALILNRRKKFFK